MTATALFVPDGDHTFVPTQAAIGPWDPRLVHGAAVGALFAGRLAQADRTLAVLSIDFLGVVPAQPLRLDITVLGGGSRVQRRRAVLRAGDKEVAAATALTIRRTSLDLPPEATAQDVVFDPAEVPTSRRPNPDAVEFIGWDGFDSMAAVLHRFDDPEEGFSRRMAFSLAVDVVDGVPLAGVELAAAAADYGQAGTGVRVDHRVWSFRNAELTLHLSREPVGDWIGFVADAVLSPVGAGMSLADHYDVEGRLGQSSMAVVLERWVAPS